MLSLDITYYMAYVVLWGIGETTIEFLIIGIPSLPMAVKAMPISKSMTSLLRSFGRQSDTGTNLCHGSHGVINGKSLIWILMT
jgi:hypothetical protein